MPFFFSANQTRFVFKLCYPDVIFHGCFTDGIRLLESLLDRGSNGTLRAPKTSRREAAIKIVSRTFQLSLPCNLAQPRHATSRLTLLNDTGWFAARFERLSTSQSLPRRLSPTCCREQYSKRLESFHARWDSLFHANC